MQILVRRKKSHFGAGVLLAMVLVLNAGPSFALEYTILDVGSYRVSRQAGVIHLFFDGLNDQGDFVGLAWTGKKAPDPALQAFVRHRTDAIRFVPSTGVLDFVNNSATLVGAEAIERDPQGLPTKAAVVAYLLDVNKEYTRKALFDGQVDVFGLNNSGDVIGRSSTNSIAGVQTFYILANTDGRIIDDNVIVPSRPWGINDQQTIFGPAGQPGAVNPDPTACSTVLPPSIYIKRIGEPAKILDDSLISKKCAIATDMNNREEIVGNTQENDFVKPDIAFFYHNGQVELLPVLPNTYETYPRAINDSSQVVGGISIDNNHVDRTTEIAFVYDQQNGMLDLNQLKSSKSDRGWDLTYAGDINKNGEILGAGTLNGEGRVFLALPHFIRGDCNSDGKVDISDAIYLLLFLFSGGSQPLYPESCNVDNNDEINISDAIFLLTYLFRGGIPPASPFPNAGCDPKLHPICAQ